MKRANPIMHIHYPCKSHGWHTAPWNITTDPNEAVFTLRQAQAKSGMNRGIDQFPSARGLNYGH